MSQFVLRFISGKDIGRAYALTPDREIVVGRDSGVDLLLVDTKVSRQHAMITVRDGRVTLQDWESRNGTFVNDRRITLVTVEVGDEIVMGSSRMKLELSEAAAPVDGQVQIASGAALEAMTVETGPERLMEGDISQIALPDLIQMLSSARKSGVLTIRSDDGVGRIYLRDGQVYYATLNNQYTLPPRKVFYRILRWTHGKFELDAVTDHNLPEIITESTTTLLFEALRQLDEMTLLMPDLPHPETRLTAVAPVAGGLQGLSTDEIQVYKLAASQLSVQAVVDQYPESDLEACTCLLRLLKRGLIAVADGTDGRR